MVVYRGGKLHMTTFVEKVGRRWVSTPLGDFDLNTGATRNDNCYSRLYSLEEWQAKSRDWAAATALRTVGVTVSASSMVSASAVYDALKGLYRLPDQPPVSF